MEMSQFNNLVAMLRDAGVLSEILDSNGKIAPTKEAIDLVEDSVPNDSPADKWRLAQAMTAYKLAERHAGDMN